MKFGYARVSTEDQDLQGQIDLLKKEGCEKIYTDVYTGSKSSRPQFNEMREYLRKDDTVCVFRLDRLSRSLKDLINICNDFKAKGVEFKSLSEKIDTSTPAGNLYFQLIGAFSEYEINIIRERTKIGLAAARARGRFGGRPIKMKPDTIRMAKALHENKNLKVKDICKTLNVGRATFYKMVNMTEEDIEKINQRILNRKMNVKKMKKKDDTVKKKKNQIDQNIIKLQNQIRQMKKKKRVL